MGLDKAYPILSKYPELFNFLSAGMAVSKEQGLDDISGAKQYILENPSIIRSTILSEYVIVAAAGTMPTIEISRASNRHFFNDDEVRQWLKRMMDIVKTAASSRGAFFVQSIPREAWEHIRKQYLYVADFILTEFNKFEYVDEEAARRYAKRISSYSLSRVVDQGNAMILDMKIPWVEIDNVASRYFHEPASFQQWLTAIIDILSDENMKRS